MHTSKKLAGVLPIVPTIFGDDGQPDEAGQRATIDFLVSEGAHGMVVLANASEGYAVADAERTSVITWAVRQTAGRVPLVVTCNHPSTIVAVRYAAEAQDLGAAAVMFLPPFFGGWIADLDGVLRHCEALSKHTTVPLILQDHPLSGVSMPASFLVDLARRVERLVYFKVEAPRAPAKIGRMRALDAVTIQGLFGGTGGVLFLEELAQGADGTMPSSLLPAAFVRVFDLYRQGDRDGADAVFRRYLPLVNFETHLGGYRAAKELLALRRTIRSAFVRGPIRSTWDDATMHAFRRMVMDLGLAPRETPA